MRDGATFPDWPGAMKAERAALYLDMSRSAFDAAVREGIAPKPVLLPKAGPRWARSDLDAWIEDQRAAQTGEPKANPWSELE